MLLLVIAAMVVVDLVFLVIVTAVDSSRFYATEQRATVGLSLTTKLLSGSSIARNVLPKSGNIYNHAEIFHQRYTNLIRTLAISFPLSACRNC